MGGSTAHRNAAYHGSQSQAWENAEGGKKKGKEQPLKEKRLVVFGRGHNGES